MTKSTCSCKERLGLESALGQAMCFGSGSPSGVIAPSRITGGGELSPHEGGHIRNCLRWEPVCQGRGSEQGAAASQAQARPFRVVALPLGRSWALNTARAPGQPRQGCSAPGSCSWSAGFLCSR